MCFFDMALPIWDWKAVGSNIQLLKGVWRLYLVGLYLGLSFLPLN